MATAQSLLDSLETAIAGFLVNGAVQSYTVDGITITRANIRDMRAWRKELKAEVASADSSKTAVNLFRRGTG